MRLVIRGYGDGVLRFKESVESDEKDLEALAMQHAVKMLQYDSHMIEIECLDEPDVNERFIRFGTDPSGMVMPFPLPPKEKRKDE